MLRIQPISWLLGLLVSAGVAVAAPTGGPEGAALSKAIAYLKQNQGGAAGESALAGLALLKSDVPPSDPAVQAILNRLASRFRGEQYFPERTAGADIYEAAVLGMFYAYQEKPQDYQMQIEALTRYLLSKQNPNGSWDYPQRNFGDTSMSQYAILGLWEMTAAGAKVSPSVWDAAAGWYLSVQRPEGGWLYHADELAMYSETVSMTAAGISSLLICRRQLYRRGVGFVNSGSNELLTPLEDSTSQPGGSYRPRTSIQAIETGVGRGLSWLARTLPISLKQQVVGPSPYYALYGIERAATLADAKTIGPHDWFAEGVQFLGSSQQGNGSWSGQYGEAVNTAWACLFLSRSTAKSIKRGLGAGTLLGGRGLPSDLSSLAIAGGRVVVRPMNAAVDQMLSVLEDPAAENSEAALAGLVEKYQKDGPSALRPYKDRFRKLLTDRDPSLRQVAAWGLGHCGDLDAVPALIAVLENPRETAEVVDQARIGLQLLSRQIEGFGPPPQPTLPQRQEAAQRWRAWYQAVPTAEADGPR